MRIHLTEHAERQILLTEDYLRDEFGRSSQSKFRREIRRSIHLMRRHPHLGPVEPLLAHRTRMYRGVVIKPYSKIIYTITDDIIEIVSVWDTRRDPAALTAEVK